MGLPGGGQGDSLGGARGSACSQEPAGAAGALVQGVPAALHLLQAHHESAHVWLRLQQTAELALEGLLSWTHVAPI